MANRKKPEHLRLTEKLQVSLTKAEYQLVETAAYEGETLSACARRIILDCLENQRSGFSHPEHPTPEQQSVESEAAAMMESIFGTSKQTPAKTDVPASGRRK